jgi:branched-chain amino acid transport system substrate-binding protein
LEYLRYLRYQSFTIVILSLFFTGCSEPAPPYQCSDPLGCVKLEPEAPLKIGVIQAISGKIAPLGQAQLRGFELALDKREKKLLGHSVEIQLEDTGCTAEGGANAALKIIADPQTMAIFGTTCSGAAVTTSEAMSSAGLTMISGNNSAPFLTSIAGKAAPSWQKGYFRTAANDENAGTVAANYAYSNRGLRKAATINDSDIYTKGLTESFREAFLALGGEMVLESAINKRDSDMLPVLTAVINSEADLLFFPLFQPEANHLLIQARQFPALDRLLLIGSGALVEKSFLEAVGESARGMCFVGPETPHGLKVDEMNQRYKDLFGEEPAVSYYLSAYDAAELLFSSIEKAVIHTESKTLYLGRQKLRDVLYESIDMQGVTGPLSCNQFGDCASAPFNVLLLEDPAQGLRGLEANIVYP